MSDNEYTLKLYTGLRVDVTEAGAEQSRIMELPDPDAWMDETERNRFEAYHSAVLAAITADPPKKDVTSIFKSDFRELGAFREMTDKISSMIHTVEDVDGKFFGVTVCQVKGELEAMEMLVLKEYCRTLHDDGMGIKRLRCAANKSHGELSIRIWRDKSHFMLTEQEVAKAPWRKQRQPKKGGDAR